MKAIVLQVEVGTQATDGRIDFIFTDRMRPLIGRMIDIKPLVIHGRQYTGYHSSHFNEYGYLDSWHHSWLYIIDEKDPTIEIKKSELNTLLNDIRELSDRVEKLLYRTNHD